MSGGCSSGGCSGGSKPWQTLPMPMQKPMWQQPWQTLPMALPQGRFPNSHGQAMSMDPQVQEVPRYGSIGDNLNHIRHIEVLPQQHALRGIAPAIQSAMPRYANWNTLPMQFNLQPYAGAAMEEPRQSQLAEGPEKPHIPDMPAPQPPVPTLPTPWTRSYTPIGNNGRCFNQCRNRCPAPVYPTPSACPLRPSCSTRCNRQPSRPRCPLRQPTWNQGPTTMCGMNRYQTQPQQYQPQPYQPQPYQMYGNGLVGHNNRNQKHGHGHEHQGRKVANEFESSEASGSGKEEEEELTDF